MVASAGQVEGLTHACMDSRQSGYDDDDDDLCFYDTERLSPIEIGGGFQSSVSLIWAQKLPVGRNSD